MIFLTPNSASNSKSRKVLLSCEKKEFITEKSLKAETEYDKSRVLLAYLEEHGKLIVKLGDKLSNLGHEYNIGKRLEKLRGYIRFLCFFNCTDDFMKYPNVQNKALCRSSDREKTMDVLAMPYYELGSIGDFKWDQSNTNELKLCLKQMLLFTIVNFDRFGFIHGDLHAKNVLMCKTDNHYPVRYKMNETVYTVERSMYDIVIMDFENSVFEKNNLNLFYIDLAKLFILLPMFIKNIDLTYVRNCNNIINTHHIAMSTNFEKLLKELFSTIDELKITTD